MTQLTTGGDLLVEQVGLATGDYLLIRRRDNFRWLTFRVPKLGQVEISFAVGHSNFKKYVRPVSDFPESLLGQSLEAINFFEKYGRERAMIFAQEIFGNPEMSIRLKGYCP